MHVIMRLLTFFFTWYGGDNFVAERAYVHDARPISLKIKHSQRLSKRLAAMSAPDQS